MKYYTLFQVHIKISNLLPSQYIIVFFFQPESLGCFDYEGSLMGNEYPDYINQHVRYTYSIIYL